MEEGIFGVPVLKINLEAAGFGARFFSLGTMG
jgi:hypothetical protein